MSRIAQDSYEEILVRVQRQISSHPEVTEGKRFRGSGLHESLHIFFEGARLHVHRFRVPSVNTSEDHSRHCFSSVRTAILNAGSMGNC